MEGLSESFACFIFRREVLAQKFANGVDLGGFGALGSFDSPRYRWMLAHGERFGWVHPEVMRPGGGGPPEPWHFEFGTG